MPILGSRGAASAKGFGLTGSGRRTSATYWLANQGISTAFNNLVAAGPVFTASYTTVPYRKYLSTGSITNATNVVGAFGSFQYTANDSNTSDSGYTSYACFVQFQNSPNLYNAAILVNNSSGSRVTSNTRLTSYYNATGVTSYGSYGYCAVNNQAQTLPSIFKYTLTSGAPGIVNGVSISDITDVYNMCTGPSGEVFASFNNTSTNRVGVISINSTLSSVNWAFYFFSTAVGSDISIASDSSYVYLVEYGSNPAVIKIDAATGSAITRRVIFSVFIIGTRSKTSKKTLVSIFFIYHQ